MNMVENAKQEEMKLERLLTVPRDDTLKGSQDDSELPYGKTMPEEKLISAINSNKQELQWMEDPEARHLEKPWLQQKLLNEMTEKTQLELNLAFVKFQVERLKMEKEAELVQFKREKLILRRRIAVHQEQQVKMQLEHERAEGRWLEQMRVVQANEPAEGNQV